MLVHDDGWSMLCGSLADQDLAQLARDDWRMYVNLFDVARCDHGPTAGGARAAEQLRTTPIEDQLGLARPAS
jgi:hypothetical protein